MAGTMQGDIVAQGIELMLYGMGTVVLFLVLLIVATSAMSAVISRYFAEPEHESAAGAALQKLRGQTSPAEDPNLIAVISAAIHQHRANRK